MISELLELTDQEQKEVLASLTRIVEIKEAIRVNNRIASHPKANKAHYKDRNENLQTSLAVAEFEFKSIFD